MILTYVALALLLATGDASTPEKPKTEKEILLPELLISSITVSRSPQKAGEPHAIIGEPRLRMDIVLKVVLPLTLDEEAKNKNVLSVYDPANKKIGSVHVDLIKGKELLIDKTRPFHEMKTVCDVKPTRNDTFLRLSGKMRVPVCMNVPSDVFVIDNRKGAEAPVYPVWGEEKRMNYIDFIANLPWTDTVKVADSKVVDYGDKKAIRLDLTFNSPKKRRIAGIELFDEIGKRI